MSNRCIASFLALLLAWCALAPSAALADGTTPDDRKASGDPAKRAFAIADYYRTRFVGEPVVRPDGAEILFAVTEYDLPKGESWSSLWRVEPSGAGLRQLTFGRHHDGSGVYSPDGRHFVFVSDREGDFAQLWRMPVDGGEPRRLTDFPADLEGPVWSPDGRWIAVTAEVDPECGADPDCNRARDESRAKHPLVAHVADRLLYRHWTGWSDQKVRHVLLVDAESGAVVEDLTPGRFPAPTFGSDGGQGYQFSPDGAEICYVSNHDEEQASSTNADLWVRPIARGEGAPVARNLTADNAGWDGQPTYSPDGKWLAFLSQATPGYESDLFRLALLERSTGELRYLTDRANFDDWIDGLRFAPDGESLWFSAEVQARTVLHRVDLRSGRIEAVHRDGVFAGWEPTPDGRSIVYNRSRIGAPPELFVVAARGGEARAITAFNAFLGAEIDLRQPEEVWVTMPDGGRVHCWVLKPHGFDPTRQYPMILNVHGGPQGSWNDRWRGDWQVYPGLGYVQVLPNPTGSNGFGQDYVDAIGCDWGGRIVEELMAVTDQLAAEPWVDSARMGAMGWSYGGYMMMWLQGHTDRFRCQAAMMGLYDLRSFHGGTEELWFPQKDLCGTPWTSEEYERWSPSRYVANFATPALVITGELDFRVPYTQSLHYFTDLQERGVPSRLIVFPQSGHWPRWHDMVFYYLAHADWFHRWLGGDPAPWDLFEYLDGRVFGEVAP